MTANRRRGESTDTDKKTEGLDKGFPFAPTRYYGSKRRQISWLAQRLLELKPTLALDAMGGTGTVTHALSTLGISVTYSDILAFNVRAAKGLFCKSGLDLAHLDSVVDSVLPTHGVVARNFRDIFYTDTENRWLDGFMEALERGEAGDATDAAFYAVIQACLKKRPFNLFHRANLYMRTANVERTFGNAVTWERDFASEVKKAFRNLVSVRESLVAPVRVASARDVLAHDDAFDLVYIDPPYFPRHGNPDTYVRRYHFLEGLADYQLWEKKIDKASRIRSFYPTYQPDEWRTGSNVLTGLECAALKYTKAKIAVSYIEGEHPSIDQIIRVLHRHRARVRKFSMETTTALSSKKRREVLVLATN